MRFYYVAALQRLAILICLIAVRKLVLELWSVFFRIQTSIPGVDVLTSKNFEWFALLTNFESNLLKNENLTSIIQHFL